MDERDDKYFDADGAEIEGSPGMGIKPELIGGQCLSLAQLQEVVAEAIRRLPSDVDPADVPVTVMGKAEEGEGESFHLQDLWFAAMDDETWEAMLITDGSGEDVTLSEM